MNDQTPSPDDRDRRSSRALAPRASGSRMPASPKARATTSTTSRCPACSTAISSAALCPCAGQVDQHRRRQGLPGVIAVLTAADLAPLACTGCRRWRATSRWCWPTARCCSRARKSPLSWRPTAMPAPTRSSWSRSTTRNFPSSSTRSRRWNRARPVLREDLAGQTDGRPRAAQTPQPHLPLGSGRRGRDERGRRRGADVVAEEMVYYHRTHPCPLETCGCVASMDKVNGKLTVWGTFQAPACGAHRRLAPVGDRGAQHPRRLARHRRRLRQQGRRLSGLCLLHRRLHRHRQAR